MRLNIQPVTSLRRMAGQLLQPLKPLYAAYKAKQRHRNIVTAVSQLQSAERTTAAIMPIVARLRACWGNDSYTADLGFLEEMVCRVLSTPGPVLDCGSGITTVILGALGSANECDVVSLEQDEDWHNAMRECLTLLGISNVTLLYAPLEVSGDAAWYSFDSTRLPRNFPLVICDGPAVRRSLWPEQVFQSWRKGVVAELRRRQVAFETIVLDDADDKRCSALLEGWAMLGLRTEIVQTATGRHVVAHNVVSSGDVALAR